VRAHATQGRRCCPTPTPVPARCALRPIPPVSPPPNRRSRRPRHAAVLAVTLAGLLDPSSAHTTLRLPLSAALMLASPAAVAEMRSVFLWLALQSVAVALSPAMKALWLTHGAGGNANFAFNPQLVVLVSSGAVAAEYAAAALREMRLEKKTRGSGGGVWGGGGGSGG
jgi:hypothetical protein